MNSRLSTRLLFGTNLLQPQTARSHGANSRLAPGTVLDVTSFHAEYA
jgi:hypothetical protein